VKQVKLARTYEVVVMHERVGNPTVSITPAGRKALEEAKKKGR
jgi:hypothetical protein